jgi:phytoene dehydrogenase-like protein
MALDEKPQWLDPEMGEVALMHLSGGLQSTVRAVSEAESGLLPAAPTICVVQPTAVDPGRAPEGKWILWLQMLEVPGIILGDAAGEIPVPQDGRWNAEIGEAFADRLVDQLTAVIPRLRDTTIYRRVLTPVDLESMNINLVGGDPYSGHCGIGQQLLFRPMAALRNHTTPVKGLYHIGASSHPGPGLGGMSGYLVAKALT